MPVFRYESLTPAAGPPEGATIEAPDRAAAVRLLIARGITPRRVEEVAGDGPGRARAERSGGRKTMTRSELATFVHELSAAVRAGLPLVPALRTIAKQGRTPAQQEMLGSLIADVERGRSLADAMRSIGKPFTDLVTNLVHAGEVSGRLAEVLTQGAVLLDRDLKLRRAILGALIYPAIVGVLVAGATAVLVTFIVPKVLGEVGAELSELPLPTRVVQGFAEFLGGWWWLLGVGLVGAIVLWRRLYADPASRLAIDRVFLRVPVLGALIRDVAVARFTRTFGTLAGAGLPVLQALRITKKTLGNAALERSMDEICEEVAHGRTIADELEASGHFPPLLVQLVAMGESTGRLDELLLQAADVFEERTQERVKIFNQVFPPILIITLASIVVLVVLAVLLPLMEMQEMIQQ